MKILKQNYQTHFLAGISIYDILCQTYYGTELFFQIFMTSFVCFLLASAWEGLCIISKRTKKYDKIDVSLVVVGGLAGFLINEKYRDFCFYAFLIFSFIYFLNLIIKKR